MQLTPRNSNLPPPRKEREREQQQKKGTARNPARFCEPHSFSVEWAWKAGDTFHEEKEEEMKEKDEKEDGSNDTNGDR